MCIMNAYANKHISTYIHLYPPISYIHLHPPISTYIHLYPHLHISTYPHIHISTDSHAHAHAHATIAHSHAHTHVQTNTCPLMIAKIRKHKRMHTQTVQLIKLYDLSYPSFPSLFCECRLLKMKSRKKI